MKKIRYFRYLIFFLAKSFQGGMGMLGLRDQIAITIFQTKKRQFGVCRPLRIYKMFPDGKKSANDENNQKVSSKFDGYLIREDLKRELATDDANSIMDYVEKAKTLSAKNKDGFFLSKVFPEFEIIFYPLIYDFLLIDFNRLYKRIDKNQACKKYILDRMSSQHKDFIIKHYKEIIEEKIGYSQEYEEIIGNDFENTISQISEAYIENLFDYILDPKYNIDYLNVEKGFSFKQLLFKCLPISQNYRFAFESQRVKELFDLFKVNQVNRVKEAAKDLLKYFESEEYKSKGNKPKKLLKIIEIFRLHYCENLSIRDEEDFLGILASIYPINDTNKNRHRRDLSSKPHIYPSNILSILNNLQIPQRRSFIFRFYNSYMILLIFAYSNEYKSDYIQKVISELDKFLDIFPLCLLYRKNLNIFTYLVLTKKN